MRSMIQFGGWGDQVMHNMVMLVKITQSVKRRVNWCFKNFLRNTQVLQNGPQKEEKRKDYKWSYHSQASF